MESQHKETLAHSQVLPRLLPKHGGYTRLRSFQAAMAVHDATVVFCDRFVERRSRTHDQMVQAARSGVQNIAEGSVASGTSKKTEIKLTNVARASLEELMRDLHDFLRQHGLPVWEKSSPEALATRRLLRSDLSETEALCGFIGEAAPEAAANTLLCLAHQASYLLHRQIERQERDFLEQGGVTERMHSMRSAVRQGQRSDEADGSDKSDGQKAQIPACPECGKPMRLRMARQGSAAGRQFWGCSGYPECRATRAV